MRKAEDGGRTAEGLLFERMEGEGGSQREIQGARDDEGLDEPEAAIEEPATKKMDESDRALAEGLDVSNGNDASSA